MISIEINTIWTQFFDKAQEQVYKEEYGKRDLKNKI